MKHLCANLPGEYDIPPVVFFFFLVHVGLSFVFPVCFLYTGVCRLIRFIALASSVILRLMNLIIIHLKCIYAALVSIVPEFNGTVLFNYIFMK